MSRMDLIETNAKIVRGVAENVAKARAGRGRHRRVEPARRDDGADPAGDRVPAERVLGQAGMLDTARFSNFVAEALGVPVGAVRTLTLGSHGDTMVPVPSRLHGRRPKPLTELLSAETIDELVTRTRNGGAEVVALLKTGLRLLRAVGCRGADGEGRARRRRRGHAGLRVGRRRVRHLAASTSVSRPRSARGGVRTVVETRAHRQPSSPACARPPRPCGPSRPTSQDLLT